MLALQNIDRITPDEYLQDELNREFKHELIDGCIYAMAGASKNHERISMNMSYQLANHLKNSPCEPFGSDMKVRVDDNFYYPDVLVVCDDKGGSDYYTSSPVIIIEVLSKSTRRMDQAIKREAYLRLPSLQEYVLIEQDLVDVELVKRSDGWQSKHYYMGDEVTFDSIGLSLPVEEIYLRVINEDVSDYLAMKAEQAKLAAEQGAPVNT